MTRSLGSLWRNADGAVAPTVALSLFALIAAGGIAFDYAHMASLDTEMQDAADQAALAAATQLDGTSGSMQRATAAAQSLLTNRTFFADDPSASGNAVSIANLLFFATAADAEAGVNGFTNTGNFKNARFVQVVVAGRKAYFALTPIVGAVTSGDISARAIAGLKSSICKIPPLMLCNPTESGSNTSFDPTAYIGKGIKLVAVGSGGGAWQPGDFGYLQNNNGVNGAPGLRQFLGWNLTPGDCLDVEDGDTKPGANTTVTDALNTRLDIYDNGQSCPSGGTCSPAADTVKDVIRPQGSTSCTYGNGGQGWQLPATGNYYGSGNFPAASGAVTVPSGAVMGFPRDACHSVSSAGTCSAGRIGNGVWDVNSYFQVNYGWTTGTGTHSWRQNTGLGASPTRYQVYSWETAHAGNSVDGVTVLGPRAVSGTNPVKASYGAPQCAAIAPASVPDRRVLTLAVVNCTANNVHGNTPDVPIENWIDAFLVEPSLNRERTTQSDIYLEVIKQTTGNIRGGTGQVTRRDVPYLVK